MSNHAGAEKERGERERGERGERGERAKRGQNICCPVIVSPLSPSLPSSPLLLKY